MIKINELLKENLDTYDKALSRLGKENEIEEEVLTKYDILYIHDTVTKLYGGDNGIRDEGLLDSIVKSPYQEVFGEKLYPNVFNKAAKYLFDFCHYQVFLDGNKRTGLAACVTYLKLNGYELSLSPEEIYKLCINIGTNIYTDVKEVSDVLEENAKFYDIDEEYEYE